MKMTNIFSVPCFLVLIQPAWSQVARGVVPITPLLTGRGSFVSAPRLELAPSALGAAAVPSLPRPALPVLAAPAPAPAPAVAAATALSELRSGAARFAQDDHSASNASKGRDISNALFDAAPDRAPDTASASAERAPSRSQEVFDKVYAPQRSDERYFVGREVRVHPGKPHWVQVKIAGLFFAENFKRRLVHLIRPDGSVQELDGWISGGLTADSGRRIFIQIDNNGKTLYELRSGSLQDIGLNPGLRERVDGISKIGRKLFLQTIEDGRYRLYQIKNGRAVRYYRGKGRISPYF